MTRVAMMGSGSWGTAFAMVLAHAGCEVTLWARDPKTVEQITTIHQNRTYHPGIELPAEVRATLTAQEALQGADYVVLAIPSQVVRANVSHWKPFHPGIGRHHLAHQRHRNRHQQAHEPSHR